MNDKLIELLKDPAFKSLVKELDIETKKELAEYINRRLNNGQSR